MGILFDFIARLRTGDPNVVADINEVPWVSEEIPKLGEPPEDSSSNEVAQRRRQTNIWTNTAKVDKPDPTPEETFKTMQSKLGSWHDVKSETPHMDALAASGIRFSDFHVGFSVCTPSRAALLTGRLCPRTGVCNNFGPYSRHGMALTEHCKITGRQLVERLLRAERVQPVSLPSKKIVTHETEGALQQFVLLRLEGGMLHHSLPLECGLRT